MLCNIIWRISLSRSSTYTKSFGIQYEIDVCVIAMCEPDPYERIAGRAVALLPELALMQPNRVLGSEVASVRKARGERGGDVKLVQVHSGTLSDREIEMLRHSFTLMAGAES